MTTDVKAGRYTYDILMDDRMMMNNLPHEIIFEIWCRLPIESVLRCRSVCKLWYKLGYDSTFINLHMSKSIKRTTAAPRPRLVFSPINMGLNRSLLMMNLEEEDGSTTDPRKIIPLVGFDEELSLLPSLNRIKVVGSCNGFLCLSTLFQVDPIFLYNPISRDGMRLPTSNLEFPRGEIDIKIFNFGFGFDSFHNKYKVIRVREAYGEIITVGESSWRKLEFPAVVSFSTPVFVDGVFYWLIRERFQRILAVDIGTEKSWIINRPPPPTTTTNRGRYISQTIGSRSSLICTDTGSLALIDHHHTISKWYSIDVWLVEGNKTLGYSFNLTTYDMSGLLHESLSAWVMAKFGNAFLLHLRGFEYGNESCLVLYSPVNHLHLSFPITCQDHSVSPQFIVPTLNSLNIN